MRNDHPCIYGVSEEKTEETTVSSHSQISSNHKGGNVQKYHQCQAPGCQLFFNRPFKLREHMQRQHPDVKFTYPGVQGKHPYTFTQMDLNDDEKLKRTIGIMEAKVTEKISPQAQVNVRDFDFQNLFGGTFNIRLIAENPKLLEYYETLAKQKCPKGADPDDFASELRRQTMAFSRANQFSKTAAVNLKFQSLQKCEFYD